jgi:hypothetical protein
MHGKKKQKRSRTGCDTYNNNNNKILYRMLSCIKCKKQHSFQCSVLAEYGTDKLSWETL